MNYDERFIFSDLTVKDKKTRFVWARDANIRQGQRVWSTPFTNPASRELLKISTDAFVLPCKGEKA